MYKLYIDTTNRFHNIVRLLKSENEKNGRGTVVGEVTGDIDIVSSIKTLLTKNNLSMKDVNFVDVNPGPGSFTGLKIGVTIANILNWTLDKKRISELVYPEYGREPNITLKKDL